MRIETKPDRNYPLLVRVIMWAQKLKYGEPLLPAKVWGRSPILLYGLQFFYRCLDRKKSPIELKLRVLINIKVSQINHCNFCIDISSALLKKINIQDEKLTGLKDFAKSDLFTKREKVALNYAVAMTDTSIGVSHVIFEELKNHFNQNEIVELTALIAYQNLSSKFNAALDIPAQGFCVK